MGSAFVGRNIRKSGKPGLQRNDASLWSDIRDLILEARRTVARGVNAALVWTNFEIGRRIVEYEQGGRGTSGILRRNPQGFIQSKLTAEFGKGLFSHQSSADATILSHVWKTTDSVC